MTRFKNILKRTNRPDEKLILLKAKYPTESQQEPEKDELGFPIPKDDLGFVAQDYEEVQELHGIVQAGQSMDIDFHGSEAQVSYVAYLMPEFNLERKGLNNYRIKYIRPYETMILKIMTYNPNLFLRHKRHHVRLGLVLEKKRD